jgi:DNA polymerase III delta prime subunit
MTAFCEYLRTRLETDGFSTEDALSSFLPLAREVVEAHAAGKVAPLEGLDALQVAGARIWFEEARRQEPRANAAAVRRIEAACQAAVEIVAEVRRTTEVDEGCGELVDLAIGRRDAEITRPVYLPGYVAWEHQLGHHDPLTDVFSLGMILASLACELDLTEPEALRSFVACRRNLFRLKPDLHPVLAQAIVRMTELDRHRRVQDLRALLHSLENYRDQEVDFELELARIPGLGESDHRSKQQVVLRKLRERLFEISRRNRLLHFRPTMQTVNLTHASVPLSFDIKNIRPDQVLVWNDAFQREILGGAAVSLNKYLNFAEALYLPGLLDHILAESRRDLAEFGFAQLRLVVCFLHWANLKEKPPEAFDSPLVLLPVRLSKKKGIRDVYTLEAASTEAEINPVVRHLFKQLYAIDLPEVLDLATTSLDQFFDYLRERIEASEPAVALSRIDRPRIALIHEKARRKLDQYRRRARLAGRGVRTFLDLDYSYDPANYHPLGLSLFAAKIRPSRTHLQEILEERPRPRSFAAPEAEPPAVERERSFFSLQEGGEENPYAWSFDLCSVTLGNFKYRKMSLVRDYEALLDQDRTSPAFEATFSLAPRAVDRKLPEAAPLDDRYPVVSCDPTQASAVEEAHSGTSYIIQGPPGTGKSQTITNLIADYVARGKRVLFVCEKRAAIDVVYARLRQRGLGDLCSLIHDSQADKREFVMDLKQTYEQILAEAQAASPKERRRHAELVRRLKAELRPLEQFDAAMHHAPADVGLSVRQLVERCVELRDQRPELTALEKERLPRYATWWQHRERIEALARSVREIRADGVLARHPLHLLAPRVAQAEHPLELVSTAAQAAQGHLARLDETLSRSGIPRDQWQTLTQARQLIDYAQEVLPVARAGKLALLEAQSAAAGEFLKAVRKLRRQEATLARAREATKAWREKLPADEVTAALDQARTLEQRHFAWLSPGWWRLRRILNRAYDFQTHVVRPRWSQVLAALQQEYAEAAKLDWQRAQLAETLGTAEPVEELSQRVLRLREAIPAMPGWIGRIHAALVRSPKAVSILARVVEAEESLSALAAELSKITDGAEQPLAELRAELQNALASLDDLPAFLECLEELAQMPEPLAGAMRRFTLTPSELEAAAADRALAEVCRQERALSSFTGAVRSRHVGRLERLYAQWLEGNAAEIRRRVRERFLENVRASSLPASQLSEPQKEFKRGYSRGRRELEHEFGKSMRFKSIRDLVSGDSGEVVKDLKPVWLMSPLSVSDTLPLVDTYFDVVIFDEASQITLEEAVPSLFRAEQAIVVGDEMQLPPTDFFSAKRDGEEDEELLVEEGGELVQYDLEGNSFLNHAAKNLPSTMLGWHYRSRSESLVSFSNWTFYDGRLLTVPEESLPTADRPPIRAAGAADGETGAAELLARSISFHLMEHGVYDKRRNRTEADYIAQLVRELLRRETGLSIGVIAFSEAQQGEIEAALDRLGQEDRPFRRLLDAELEREVDGQFVGLLVKNLENIQGDERDIMILSICYGPGPNGKMLMNFGPINKSGGEKRLNVAFSRAKHHMAVVSSIQHTAITNEYNDGANCLKNYLCYAEAVSTGDTESVRRVLRGMSRWQDTDDVDHARPTSPVADQLAAALAERGYLVDRAIGQSHFRCDLAVRRAGEAVYRLAILCDHDAYYDQSDLLERDLMRPKLLRDFGWNVTFVLAKDWYADPRAVLDGLLHLLETGETSKDETETESEEVSVDDEPEPEQR